MLTTYENQSGVLEPHKNSRRITEQAVWIDLLNPKEAEVTKVERALKLDVPTREEQREIEASSRLYQENGAHFMTATVLYQADMTEPVATPITFILAGNRLITLRYAEPRAFAIFAARCARPDSNLTSGMTVLIGLIEAIVDRLADFIERIQGEVDKLSHSIFEMEGGAATRQQRFDVSLKSIGREGEITSRARDSAHSLGRLLTFLAHAANERKEDKLVKARDSHRGSRRRVADRSVELSLQQDRVPARRDARHDQHRAEQYHQDFLHRRGRISPADASCLGLRHEFRVHARAKMGVRLSPRHFAHGRLCGGALCVFSSGKAGCS